MAKAHVDSESATGAIQTPTADTGLPIFAIVWRMYIRSQGLVLWATARVYIDLNVSESVPGRGSSGGKSGVGVGRTR